jgi:predicted porin
MKKLALAAALATAFAGSAFAQSSVNLYGRINTSIEHFDNGDQTVTGLKNSSSRWGLRGTEDLGDGLSAYFQLEAGFNSDTGAGSGGFSRDAYVGLKSNSLGQIKLGKFTSALYYGTIDYIGVFNHDTGTTSEDNIWVLNSVVFNNAVEYTSPKLFGGFEFIGTIAAGEKSGPDTYELAANYDAGDLHVGGGYSESKGRASATDPSKIDLSGIAVAASYVFGPLFAGISYDHVDVKGAADLGKRDSVTATAMYTMGNNEFHVSIGHAGEWDNVDNSAATQYTLGYNYNLSKRTKLYAFYFAVDNDNGAVNAIPYGPSLGSVGPVRNDNGKVDRLSVLGVGIRHNF